MYNEYFGFKETPFSIAPDPHYLYMSEQHREALAHLLYGFNSDGGFVLLTGEIGTGKTTVCRCLLEQIPENSAIAFIFNPKLTAIELLETMCDEFGIDYPEGTTSAKAFVDLINAFLLEADSGNQKAVLIIDEAQNLSFDVLEQLRLLTNLETSHHKLLQIILLGQPELRDILAQPELLQLSQRIVARFHLGPLSKKDVGAYIKHRLSVAGMRRQLFPDTLIDKLYRYSSGVPRIINVLCDRSLLGAYSQNKDTVDSSTLTKAAREVFGKTDGNVKCKKPVALVLLLFVAAVFGIVIVSTYLKSNPVNGSIVKESSIKIKDKRVKSDNVAETVRTGTVDRKTGPSTPNIIQWSDDVPVRKSNIMAFKALLHQWGIKPEKAIRASGCKYFRFENYRCIKGAGGLNNLFSLNRPAVLKLFDKSGNIFYAALIIINDDQASLILGDNTVSVDIGSIEAQWLGDYYIIWKTPPGYRYALMPKSEDAAVIWLKKQLSLIRGTTSPDVESAVFDDRMVSEVKAFQIVKGLVPDGIVGPKTLIHLNTLTDSSVPLLIREPEES